MIRRSLAIITLLVLFVSLGALVGLAAVIEVKTGSFYYEDSTVGDDRIVAEVGDQLRFVIEDGGKGTPHTVEIPGLGISSGPLATKSVYVTAVLAKPGEYQLFCKPHRKKGHETTLIVTGEPLTTTTAPTTTTTTPPATEPTTTTTGPADEATTTTGSTTTTLGTTTTTVDPSAGDEGGTGSAGEVGAEATGETIPVGVSEPDTPVWTRVFPLAGVALLLVTVIAVFAGRRSMTGQGPEA